jgi:hypothetical protein
MLTTYMRLLMRYLPIACNEFTKKRALLTLPMISYFDISFRDCPFLFVRSLYMCDLLFIALFGKLFLPGIGYELDQVCARFEIFGVFEGRLVSVQVVGKGWVWEAIRVCFLGLWA